MLTDCSMHAWYASYLRFRQVQIYCIYMPDVLTGERLFDSISTP